MTLHIKELREEDKHWTRFAIQEEIRLNKIFATVIMSKLPDRLRNLREYFCSLPPAESKLKTFLYSEDEKEIFEAGKPYSEELLGYGLTPRYFCVTMDLLSSLLERIERRNLWPEKGMRVDLANRKFEDSEIQKEAVRQIIMGTDVTEKQAELILAWVLEVWAFDPRFLGKFSLDQLDSLMPHVVSRTVDIEYPEN